MYVFLSVLHWLSENNRFMYDTKYVYYVTKRVVMTTNINTSTPFTRFGIEEIYLSEMSKYGSQVIIQY